MLSLSFSLSSFLSFFLSLSSSLFFPFSFSLSLSSSFSIALFLYLSSSFSSSRALSPSNSFAVYLLFSHWVNSFISRFPLSSLFFLSPSFSSPPWLTWLWKEGKVCRIGKRRSSSVDHGKKLIDRIYSHLLILFLELVSFASIPYFNFSFSHLFPDCLRISFLRFFRCSFPTLLFYFTTTWVVSLPNYLSVFSPIS